MSVDWSTAPEGAEFYADTKFRKIWQVWVDHDNVWSPSVRRLHHLQEYEDYEENPETQASQEWPTESRIDIIGTNGNTGEAYMHYDEQREAAEKMAAREAHIKQSAEQNRAPDSLGKYDRTIKGKHNTGTCTVDVYRVLSAFEITEPELQHCIKKLLAAGQRGAKDYQQDLREASASLRMLIDRLQE